MPGLLRGVARTAVVAGTATAVSNRVSRRQAGRGAAPAGPRAAAPPRPPRGGAPPPQYAAPAPAPAATDARIEQLTQLAALRAQGGGAPAEFAAQKARIHA